VGVSNGNTLVIRGDAAANVVSITQNDPANTLTIVADGVTQVFDSTQITRLDVDLKAGDDHFFWDLATGKDFFRSKEASILLGDGTDEAWLDFRGGGIGGTSRLFGNLNVTVNGGLGDDDLVAHFNGKDGGLLKLTAVMYAGDDNAFTNLWGDVTGGANVTFDLRGGAGVDTLHSWNTFDNRASSWVSIDVALGSAVTILMDGGVGDDTVSVDHFSGAIDGRLTIDLHGGLGNDQVRADVLLTDGTGTLDAKVQGDAGDDHLSFALTDDSDLWITLPGRGPIHIIGVRIVSALMDGGADFDHNDYATPNVTVVSCEGTIIL
jgi:hypothetical protein